ncbi:Protein of unknown function [Pyronema omphalodes CBS 100304]|uniref:Uncharacterized protein n=1 Tax=Pyronema omphalodes (strain CBS 100304) TaxID=1076935 RepID=U4L981_PYROM|nr:Protein of unknown function [Pyronema omphalodes CBS 100304]
MFLREIIVNFETHMSMV